MGPENARLAAELFEMAGDDGVAARALFPTRAASTPSPCRLLVDLERACRPDAILATNTSTIDVELIAAKTQAADRIVGAHFFSPAHVMPLLEIVRTPKTSKQASRAGRGWVERRRGRVGLRGVEGALARRRWKWRHVVGSPAPRLLLHFLLG